MCGSTLGMLVAGCGEPYVPAEEVSVPTYHRATRTESNGVLPTKTCSFLSTKVNLAPITGPYYKAEVSFQLLEPAYVRFFFRYSPAESWENYGFTPGAPRGVEEYRFLAAPLIENRTCYYKFIAYDTTSFPPRECGAIEGSFAIPASR